MQFLNNALINYWNHFQSAKQNASIFEKRSIFFVYYYLLDDIKEHVKLGETSIFTSLLLWQRLFL